MRLRIAPQVLPERDLVVEEGEVALGQVDHVVIRHPCRPELEQHVRKLPVGEEAGESNRVNAESFRCSLDRFGGLASQLLVHEGGGRCKNYTPNSA